MAKSHTIHPETATGITPENRKLGRGEGVTGRRSNPSIIHRLGLNGITEPAHLTTQYWGLALALVALHGLHQHVLQSDGKPGKNPRLAKLPRVEGLVFAACKVPALDVLPAGLEIVDHKGGVWRAGLDGKPARVTTLDMTHKVAVGRGEDGKVVTRTRLQVLEALDSDKERAENALAMHIGSHDMLEGVALDLRDKARKAKGEAKPEGEAAT